MSKISIVGVNKAELLAALYNASKPQGMGFMHYDPKPMTSAEADNLLKQSTFFDYLKGRVMKIDLSSDTLETHSYNRDNGENAAEKVVEILAETHLKPTVTIVTTAKMPLKKLLKFWLKLIP